MNWRWFAPCVVRSTYPTAVDSWLQTDKAELLFANCAHHVLTLAGVLDESATFDARSSVVRLQSLDVPNLDHLRLRQDLKLSFDVTTVTKLVPTAGSTHFIPPRFEAVPAKVVRSFFGADYTIRTGF